MDNRSQLLVHVSELYYQQGLNQQEISKIMNLSRPTISRLLEEAKAMGIVEIIVHSPIEKNPKLSYALRTAFGLRDAIVVAGEFEYDKAISRCAQTAAHFLGTVMDNNMSIGISWGRALEALCDAIKPAQYYNINVVQMVGCLGTGNPRVDGLELAIKLSKKLDGNYSNIYAPVYVNDELVYSYLIHETQIETTLKKALSLDVVLTGIGSLDDPNGSLYQAGCYSPEDRVELMRRGAVSTILGRMLDRDGNEVRLEDHYVISAPLESMRYPSWSIALNVTKEKAACTLAAVRGKHLNTLIVDEPLAREMLRLTEIPFDE